MTVGEMVLERLWATDWRAMDEFLQGLDEEDLALARKAYRDSAPRERQEVRERLPDRGRHDSYRRCEQLMALALADTPRDVLEGAEWWHAWEWDDDWELDGVVLERIAARGKRWVAGFVTEVAKGRVVGADDLVRHLRALILHFDLPQPAGKLYREHWSSWLTVLPHLPAREAFHAIYAQQREWTLDAEGRRVAQTPTRYLPVIERLRREPHLHQLVRDTMAVKRGMHDWDPKREDPIQAALVALVEEGVFTREELVEDAWAILGRMDTPSTHRAAADLLVRLVDTDALAASFPMLLGCLTSVHGTVTSVLLPPAVDAARDEDDLRALCEVIFARTEKRQRVDLLGVLTSDAATTRWSATTVDECLRLAAEVDDVKLSATARKALQSLSAQTSARSATDTDTGLDTGLDANPVPDTVDDGAPVLSGLWRDDEPAEVPPAPFVTLDGGQVVADAFNTARYSALGVDTPTLDVLMRWARSDRAGLEAWLRSFMWRPEELRESFQFRAALSRWTWGELDRARRHTMVDRVHHYFGAGRRALGRGGESFPGDPNQGIDFLYASPVEAFLALLTQESLARAGEVPFLLSRPSRVDGTVTFSDLVARIRRYDGLAAGPLDLFQALLRLDHVPTDRVSELDGLTLPLWSDDHPIERDRPQSDGVDLVRGWIRGGGLPSLEVRFDAGYPVLELSPWPEVLSALPTVPAALVDDLGWAQATSYEVAGGYRGHWRRRDDREAMLALPHWPDLFAVDVEPLMSSQRDQDVVIWPVMSMTGPAGRGRQHLIVSALNARTLERRLEGVDAAISLVASGRWNEQAHADVTVAYLDAGHLGLARSASSWHQLALAGELRAIWPTVLAVLDVGAVMPRKPVGYPEVLAVARKLVAAVPDPTLPQSVHDLAASKGSTRSHLEARALVAAVTR